MPREKVREYLKQAEIALDLAVLAEECELCSSHLRKFQVLLKDFMILKALSDDLKKGEVREFAVKLGKFGEEMGAWSIMGKVLHKIRGWGT